MVTRLLAHLSLRRRRERGQALVLVTLLLAVIGGMTAIAIDVGSYSADRRDLQNAADAIALAASLELPNAANAQSKADEWAVKNDIDPADMTVTVIPQNLPDEPNPKVRVTIERDHDFTFARVLGINSAEVQASAAGIKTSPAGGDGAVPLSVTEASLAGATLGQEVVLKYDARNPTLGNFSPLVIDSPGAGNCEDDKYCAGLKYGSQNVVCAEGADDTYCDGPSSVPTQTGNLIGPTNTAINYRLNSTDEQCDEFEEVFEDDPLSSDAGVYRIVQACNPFLSGSYNSYQVLIVPVIDEHTPGALPVNITTFSLFYLDRIGSGGCTGNECEVVGRFVAVHQNVGLLAGTFDAQAANHFVRLVE